MADPTFSLSIGDQFDPLGKFFPGNVRTVVLNATVPFGAPALPATPTFSFTTTGVVSATADNFAPSPTTTTAFSATATITAVAPGVTIISALENGVDNSPSSDIQVTVSTRPSDVLSFDPSSVKAVISG